MVTNLEYTVLARNAYPVAESNKIDLPGWNRVVSLAGEGWGGFAATVFQKGGEVVISFRGTDGESIDWDLIQERLQARYPTP